MIVVSLTSWIKRIDTVKKVVESIMNNTIRPDRLYLNLSRTEFDGRELPKDLVKYFDSDDRLIINWVDGENTKSMKKVFPILQYLNDDDIIITADDDILFPKDLIEARLKDFNNYDKKYAITSNMSKVGIFKDMYVASAVSLYTKRMLKNWKRYVNNDIIRTYNDDRTYLYILWMSGYLNKPCTKYDVKTLVRGYDLQLRDSSMTVNKVHIVATNYDTVAQKRIKQISMIPLQSMFGYFNKKRYDCVMVYGKSGVDSKEMTCGEHLEIEYVIASLKKYCSSWCGRIFIVGSEPPQCIRKDVVHIPCDNPYTHCKDANIIHKLRYACEHISDLSEDFLMISDDQIVTRTSTWEDMTPRIVRRFCDWSDFKWQSNRKIDSWHEYLYRTLKLFPKEKAAFWEPHIWSPMNKHKFIEMCKKYDYAHSTACISQSLYYNFTGQKIKSQYEHTHLGDSNALRKIKSLKPSNISRHLSWSDAAFFQKGFRDLLDVIVGFKDSLPKCEEKPKPAPSRQVKKNKSRIEQLRDDIANGRVVKVPSPSGLGFVWKRVK